MGTRNFHWDPIDDCVMSETDGSGATIVTYTHEPRKFGPLLSENRGATEFYHHYDALGSTTMLTNDSGTVSDTFMYDVWGNVVIRTGITPTPYRWIGRMGYQFDSLAITFYVRGRSYQPGVARWSSAGKDLALSSSNLYVYVHSPGVSLIDQSGFLQALKAFPFQKGKKGQVQLVNGPVPFSVPFR